MKTKEMDVEERKPIIKKYSMSQDALAGAFAGFSSRMLTAPFDVIKIRNQLLVKHLANTPPMFKAMRSIAKDEGIGALWKGNVPALMLWMSYSFIQFASYGKLKDIYESQIDEQPNESEENINRPKATSLLSRSAILFMIGAAAGTLATVVTYPFDIMRTQFAVQETTRYFNGIGSYLQYTHKTYGWKGFFSGCGPAVMGVTPYIGLNFALYETLKSLTSSSTASSSTTSSSPSPPPSKLSYILSVVKKGLLGGIAGGTSKLIIYPLDTMKKRMQAQALHGAMDNIIRHPQYSTMIGCMTTIFREEGMRGFYRGIVPTLVKAASSTAITFMSYEMATEFLQSISAKSQ